MEIEDLRSNKKGGGGEWNRFFYKRQKEYLLSPLSTNQTSRNASFEKNALFPLMLFILLRLNSSERMTSHFGKKDCWPE